MRILFYSLFLFSFVAGLDARADKDDLYWMKIRTKGKFERSAIANLGITIEGVDDDFVIAYGNQAEFAAVEKTGRLIVGFPLKGNTKTLDFPTSDSQFHNYAELTTEMNSLAAKYPDLTELKSIGKSYEGRDLNVIRITKDIGQPLKKPAVIFMGGHHAREHVSIEVPYLLAKYLLEEYTKANPRIVKLLETREIHIIPVVNPDGAEFDIASGNYQMWRKNRRRNNDGTMGVDLNRNYAFQWGTGGSSKSGSSDVYMGTQPFSEPETQAVKAYVESQTNITILLSFHTFSELILYPWGHTYNAITDAKAKSTHETMARTMAKWNGYTPEQSSDLYIASGDTTDWSFGQLGIISFTFELDPKSMFSGGFYPGQSVINPVFQKNLEPCLYLIDLADDPYRVLIPTRAKYGVSYVLNQN